MVEYGEVPETMRAAAIQTDPRLGDVEYNLRTVRGAAAEAAAAGAELAVFPECAVTGYMCDSLDEGIEIARRAEPASDELHDIAREHDLYLIVGLLEREGDRLYNAAALVGPDGYHAVYRKSHTLCLGVDRFASPGNIPYTVHNLPIGRVGMLICYDLRFPEAARTLALAGAQVIALPTNWPTSSTIMPEVFARSRAAENRVYLVAADRVGRERKAAFLGRSVIVTPTGEVVAEAGMRDPEMLVADLDLSAADEKHVVFAPGEHEMDLVGDRRPDLYRVDTLRDVTARSA